VRDAEFVRYLRPRTSHKGLRSRLVNVHWLQTKLQFETVWLAETTGCQILPKALVLASARPKCFRPRPQLGLEMHIGSYFRLHWFYGELPGLISSNLEEVLEPLTVLS